MEIQKTKIEGVYIIKNNLFNDDRGKFIKIFSYDFFKENGLCSEFKENYFSVSKAGVIRGMHFQLPPYDHEKLVFVIKGKVLDVLLDLRKSSRTFGQYLSVELSEESGQSVYIPKGLAHGFKSLEDDTVMVYHVSTPYEKSSDAGIRWNSFNFDWKCKSPIISDRDQTFETFETFAKKNIFK